MVSKGWSFTINNPTEADDPKAWADVKYLVFQKEKGKEGTPHFQGYVFMEMACRLTKMKKLNSRAHWGKAEGTPEQNRHYCTKPTPGCECKHCKDCPPRLDGPWEVGDCPQRGKRTDLDEVAEYAKTHTMTEIAQTHPGMFVRYHQGFAKLQKQLGVKPPERTWHTDLIIFWGLQGTSKSTFVKKMWPDAYWLPKPAGTTTWWPDYNGEDTVIIDEFYGWLQVDLMCRLIDKTPRITVEYKGGNLPFLSKRIVITSNADPWTWWKCEYHGMERRLKECEARGNCHHVTKLMCRAQWPEEGPCSCERCAALPESMQEDELLREAVDQRMPDRPHATITTNQGSVVFSGVRNEPSATTQMVRDALTALRTNEVADVGTPMPGTRWFDKHNKKN